MHYKQNNKETKSYVQGLRSFGKILPRGVKGILKRNGYNYAEIINKWSELVGKEVSNYSHPKSIKMTSGDKNGILVVAVKYALFPKIPFIVLVNCITSCISNLIFDLFRPFINLE